MKRPNDIVIEEAANWIAAQRRGMMTVDELERCARWQEIPANRAALTSMHELWGEVAALKLASFNGPLTQEQDQPASGKRKLSAAIAMIACVSLAFSVGVSFFSEAEASTGIGEQRSLNLPDGSIANLNVVTELQYPRRASARALELLKGEALLTIRRDSKPFKLNVSGYRVESSGGTIDVRYRDGRLSVSVADGHASVHSIVTAKNERVAHLDAGQRFEVGEGVRNNQTVSPVAIERMGEWRIRAITYDDEMVGQLIKDINNYYGRALTASPDISSQRVTVRLILDDRAKTINNLAALLNADVIRHGESDVMIAKIPDGKNISPLR